jgi:predicted Fe-Mo cluster-binding NifX family protein
VITAIPYWKERVAPVFDTARQFVIVKSEQGGIIEEERMTLEESNSLKVSQLKNREVDTLICGAISKPIEITLLNNGIRVFAFISGNLENVIAAWIKGELKRSVFIMPGCRFSRRHQYGMQGLSSEEVMNMPRGKGQGTGRGMGRNQGPLAAGPNGSCVCPGCGYSEPHQRGVPCTQKKCPKCGTALTRQ